jgi:signal transduction histidine kinase
VVESRMAPVSPAPDLRDRWSELLSTAGGIRRVLAAAAIGGVLLAAGAASMVWRSAVGHRETAERLLQEQANFLAVQYANSAQLQSWYAVRVQLHTWREVAGPGGRFPAAATVEARVRGNAIGPALANFTPDGWFRLDAGRFRYLANGTDPDTTALRRWQDAVAFQVSAARLGEERFSYLVTPQGETIFFTADRGGTVGFIVPLAQWRTAVFAPLTAHIRLDHDTAAQTAISVRVTAPDKTVLFETAPPVDDSARVGRAWMSGSLSAAIELTYPESGVQWVVPGGLPREPRLTAGMVFGTLLLALLAALVVVQRALTLALLRSEFTSTISHELRTPLTQVLLYAETLGRDRPLAPEQRAKAVDVIVREARRLVQMVENVLALSRVGRPELRVVRRPERIDRLVHEVLAGFEPMLRERGIRADIRVEVPLEAAVDGDAVRQVLINLVDNAVRHGPAAQEVVIAAVRDDGRLRLTVDDAGPGIPAHQREQVWRPFVRLAAGAGSAGSGIGLAVVKQLAELHGGRAWIEDAPIGGTRFVIELAVGDRPEG